MNRDDLFKSIGEIDESMILKSDKSSKNKWTKWVGLVASIVIVICVGNRMLNNRVDLLSDEDVIIEIGRAHV